MTTQLFTLSPGDSAAEAKRLFSQHRFHHIPVVRGKHLEGIISRQDLAPFSDELLAKMEAEDVMTKKVAVVAPDQAIGVAAEIFLANLFHALPVVENDELVGLVSTFDVLHYCFLKFYPGHDAITIPDQM